MPAIDGALVRALLQEQHRDLADLAIRHVDAGWDNDVFRLGDGLAVRLPRRQLAVDLIAHEQRWLPHLAPRLPLPVPAPVRIGRASPRFAAPWSVVPWLPGRNALNAPFDAVSGGRAVGRFLEALHAPAPADAPHNPLRGVPLERRTARVMEHADTLAGVIDSREVRRAWERAVTAAPWAGPPLWLHGDLHPGNLLVHDGSIAAVIDFGDLCAGDPATDFALAWMLPSPLSATGLWHAAGNRWRPIDADLMRRACGWALAISLAIVASPLADAATRELALATARATLTDEVLR